jgi:hypothetical protein
MKISKIKTCFGDSITNLIEIEMIIHYSNHCTTNSLENQDVEKF